MKRLLPLALCLIALPASAHPDHAATYIAGLAGYLLASAAILILGRKLGNMRLAGALVGGAGLCLLAGVA